MTFVQALPTATFEELFRGRKVEFRAINALRRLERRGIEAHIERVDLRTCRVVAEAENKWQARYLKDEGYTHKRRVK